MARQVLAVSQINRYVKRLLDSDALLAGVFIEGEISNFNAHRSGHLYFTLKDEEASISSVMFQGYTENLKFVPKSGMKVIAFGRLSLYEKTGSYQLYAEHMEPAGIGGLQLAFNALCDKLRAEGLFDSERKRPIPCYPACVAVITSPTGAAVMDIIRTVRQRNRVIKLVIIPALVQGAEAGGDIARGLKEANAWGGADAIILGRGGGSTEDLWAFNEEIVARAIADSKIPVISAVGHETDFTVSDFVADYRAPTPTAAAQVVAYDQAEISEYLLQKRNSLKEAMGEGIRFRHAEAKDLMDELCRIARLRLAHEKEALSHAKELLEKVSPYAAFRRGFALVRKTSAQDQATGRLVTALAGISTGDKLTLEWADGLAQVEVLETKGASQ